MAWPESKRVIFVEGRGAILKDIDGKEYIDACAGANGPTLVGHSHPRYIQAISKQVEKLSQHLPCFNNVPLIELCEKLARILPGNIHKSYVCAGGSEAIESAIKLIMRRTGKNGFISLYCGYHGLSLGLLNLVGMSWNRSLFPHISGPLAFQQIPNPYCYRCHFGLEYPGCDLECANALEYAIKYSSSGNVAAFILEVVQGPGGQIEFPKEYFSKVKEICAKNGVLIIVDEIQTGLGRCGAMFASELYNFIPDVLVVGKALGGGFPIGVASFSDELFSPELNEKTWHALTFQNQPLACAVASAIIDIAIEENFPERAKRLGAYCKKALIDLSREHEIVGDVRGPGLFLGIELVKDRKTKEPAITETQKVIYSALDKGLIIFPGGMGNVIKVKPPLTITEEQIDRIVEILDEAFGEIR